MGATATIIDKLGDGAELLAACEDRGIRQRYLR